MKHRMALAGSLLLALAFAWSSSAEPVKVIFDTDMITDFDDVGALACLHALADAGECEILATISSTRGNASVGAVEVINHYYGRPDIPVGAPKGMGVMGAHPGAKTKVDPSAPLGEKSGNDGGHYKYRKLLADYPGWYRYADSDDAPDANEVYRRVLAAQPDGSVTICSVGFITNMRRLLETKPDDISPLDGKALVAKKVKLWVAMACQYPSGREYNSKWDAESSRIAFSQWPTPVIFSDAKYGRDCFAGRAVAEMDVERSPVKDVFARRFAVTPPSGSSGALEWAGAPRGTRRRCLSPCGESTPISTRSAAPTEWSAARVTTNGRLTRRMALICVLPSACPRPRLPELSTN